MNGVIVRGIIYVALAVLGVFSTFFSQYYEAWLQDPSLVFSVPGYVWGWLGITSAYQGLLVLRSFLDGSVERGRMEARLAGTEATNTQ